MGFASRMTREEIAAIMTDKVPMARRMGLRVDEVAPGRVRVSAPLAGNTNHIGTMYAGAIFTLAEMPGGGLALTRFDINRYFPILKHMEVSFRRPLASDASVELTMSEAEAARIAAEVAAKGKCDFVLEGDITDQGGQVCAQSRGVYQLRAL